MLPWGSSEARVVSFGVCGAAVSRIVALVTAAPAMKLRLPIALKLLRSSIYRFDDRRLQMIQSARLRWLAFSVFVISSTLNYLDRQLLATLAPLIMAELDFNQTGFGFLISAFSIAYAASSLMAGWFLD